jgi:hypothetical protein
MSSVLFSKDLIKHFEEKGEITCSPAKTLWLPILIVPEIT